MKRNIASKGEHGGRAIRRLRLLGEAIAAGADIPGKILLEVPLRQRLALEGGGYVKFYDQAAGSKPNKDESTGKKAATKATPKPKTAVKKKATAKRKSGVKAGNSKKKSTPRAARVKRQAAT